MSVRGSWLSILLLAVLVSSGGCGKKAEETPPTATASSPEYPSFPWPPPRPTSRYMIPGGLVVAGAGDSLRRAFEHLTAACDTAGIEWSAYAIDSTGFAVVSQMDSIGEDGTPKRSSSSAMSGLSIEGRGNLFRRILDRLFKAAPGRYRVIVFAVTGRPMRFSADTLSRTGATNLLAGGELYLPADLAAFTLGPNGRCEALIYEFRRPSEVDTANWVGFGESNIKARDHLLKSKLWSKEALSP